MWNSWFRSDVLDNSTITPVALNAMACSGRFPTRTAEQTVPRAMLSQRASQSDENV